MKQFKGTPGTYHTHREGLSTVYVECKLRDGVLQEVAACGPTEGGSDEQFANAQLFAAAPELLEALQSVIEYFKTVTCPPLDKAQAAINKALGE